MKNIVQLIVILLLLSTSKQQNLLNDFLKLEDSLKNSSLAFVELFNNRCSGTCTPSYLSCSDKQPILNCSTIFQPTGCPVCSSNSSLGQLLNFENTTVELANRFPPFPNESMPDVRELICSSYGLIDSWMNLDPSIMWRYVGTHNGVFRILPGNIACYVYDPRFRPWYNTAATGQKNIVFILDDSLNMNDLSHAKEMLDLLIETLVDNDNVGLLLLSDNVTLFSETMTEINDNSRSSITAFIDQIMSNNSTKKNYIGAINATHQLFESMNSDSTDRQNIIILISNNIALPPGVIELFNIVDQFKRNSSTTMFSYGFGQATMGSLLQELACHYSGLFKPIPEDNFNMVDILKEYFLMLYNGVNLREVVWSAPYLDAAGLGNLTTAAIPVYYENNGARFLLGVIGFDILLKTYENNTEFPSTLEELIKRNRVPLMFNTTDCQLELLRGDFKCNTATANNDTNVCSPFILTQPLCPMDMNATMPTTGLTFVEGSGIQLGTNALNLTCCCL